jgi:predicted HTH transcriptional regulator
MNTLIIFGLGFVLGAAAVYFLMRQRKVVGIASHVQNQKSEKQERKEKILAMIREKGSVTNNDIETALGVSDASATNYLQELEQEGLIEQIGKRGRFVSYRKK